MPKYEVTFTGKLIIEAPDGKFKTIYSKIISELPYRYIIDAIPFEDMEINELEEK